MFKTMPAAAFGVALWFGLGAGGNSFAAPNNHATLCADPAVLAAIDSRESANINESRLPGSGLLLASLPALSGIRITDHRIELVDGRPTRDPNVAVCLVKMHLQAQTANGVKQADENFAYHIERSANSYDVRFCPNRHCAVEPTPIKLAGPVR